MSLSFRPTGERGQVLVLVALSMTVLLGITALAIDASFMYDKRNRLAGAADSGAKSAALEILRKCGGASATAACSATGNLWNFAAHEVTSAGFTPVSCGTTTGGVTTCVTFPFTCPTGVDTGATCVKVELSEATPTFFAGVLGWTSLTPTADAIAAAGVSGSDCIRTLRPHGTSDTNTSLELNGGLNTPDCTISNAGNIVIDGGNPPSVANGSTAGICTGNGNACQKISQHTIQPTDPLNLTAPSGIPTTTSTCPGTNCVVDTVNNKVILTAGNKYGDIAIDSLHTGPKNGWELNFSTSGIYYLSGNMSGSGNSMKITGPTSGGLMLYLYNDGTNSGRFTFTGNGLTANLTARVTADQYNGVILFQNASDTQDSQLGDVGGGVGNSIILSGVIYVPGNNGTALSPKLTFGSSLGSGSSCAILVVWNLFLNNSGTFYNNCAGFGGSPLTTAAVVD